MIAEPDGVEVVWTAEDAARLVAPPLLVVESVRVFLDDAGLGEGPLSWQRIGEGQSNVTYLIQRGEHEFVLRRGPRPPLPRSTHDMVREARIQTVLRRRGYPVPNILAVCDDVRILGVPFYVMGFVHGLTVTDTVPAAFDEPHRRRAVSEAAVDALAELHSIDISGELSGFGRPDGYLRRQIDRFEELHRTDPVRMLPTVSRLATWLRENMPSTSRASVVHGDFRLGNLMFSPDAPVEVAAVLDWEMATIGDPLADLGYLTATYGAPGVPSTVMELTPATREPGFLDRDGLVERYAEKTGAALADLTWYQALALWKSAVFCEAIYTRWLRGERPDDEFGPRLAEGVPALLDAAADVANVGLGSRQARAL